MHIITRSLPVALALLVFAVTTVQAGDLPAIGHEDGDPLPQTIFALDSAAFDAFNHCEDPAQLQEHASYFADDVEFYHDIGGVTWTRADMLANTENNACGRYRRELVAGSLRVYPVKDFGAIEQGVHRFCQVDSGDCEGLADFIIVWHDLGGRWEITRVLSYGHRPSPASAL